MLLKSHISNIQIHSDEWFAGRLAKFTASEMYNLMGEKPETTGALSYIYKKVGEELTGLAARDEADTPSTRHGLLYEADAIRLYAQKKGLSLVVTQKLIFAPESRFGCTPDLLEIVSESQDGTAYNVITGEVKCPLTYNAYIGLFLCNTPADVKKEEKKYYWQVISQMDLCGALKGYLIVYHPEFKAGNMKIIEFRKIDLANEFKLLNERKKWAVEKFESVREKLLAA